MAGIRYMSSYGYTVQYRNNNFIILFILSIILVWWIGQRPISGKYFGDTSNYALLYKFYKTNIVSIDWQEEWFWDFLMTICKSMNMDVSAFFTVIEAGYVFTVLWAVKKLMPSNPGLGMLFVWSSLMYFFFFFNRQRDGLACHIILLALAFVLERKYLWGGILALLAFGIHRSVMLPIATGIVALCVLKNVKYAIYFWLSSIFLSLLVGGPLTSFFASLGFDDRMSGYTNIRNDMSQFSQSGFRWDFLLYSAMPVWMAWYVCIKRGISDRWYDIICIIYCLCNAFWIIVIRSSFSNRFAYLSWFLYPIVVAYPLVNLQVWEEQDRKTGQILLAYCGFTVFMQLIYW